MKLSEIMTPDPITLEPDCSLDDAITLFERCDFRHLPVVDDDVLVGMLSDRDLSLATGWVFYESRKDEEGSAPRTVREVMRSPVLSLDAGEPLGKAAAIMVERKVGAIPVVDEGAGGKLVGIVTETNLLGAIRSGHLVCGRGFDLDGAISAQMTREVRSLSPEDLMNEAIEVCTQRGFRHVPIVEDGRLVGIVSDRDLRFGMGQEIVSDMNAEQSGRMEVMQTPLAALMSTDVVALKPDARIGEAIDKMLKHRFSALPVVDGADLVGMFTPMDVLRHCV